MSLIVKARKTKMAVPTPNLPIFETNLSSLSSRGVSCSLSSSNICSLSLPAALYFPTTRTSIFMKPLVRLVPLIKIGLGAYYPASGWHWSRGALYFSMAYPVIEPSSTTASSVATAIPSAGI